VSDRQGLCCVDAPRAAACGGVAVVEGRDQGAVPGVGDGGDQIAAGLVAERADDRGVIQVGIQPAVRAAAAVDLAVAVRSRSIPVSIREPQIVLPTRVLRPQRLDA